jgi:hypothetical protein
MPKNNKKGTRKKSRSGKRNMRGGRLTEEGLRFLINACKSVKPNVESVRTYLQNYHRDRADTFSKSDIKVYLGYMGSSISTKHETFAVIKRKDREAAERERLGLDVKIPPGDRDGRHPGRRRSRRRRGHHYPGPPPSPLSSSSSSSSSSHGDDGHGSGRRSMFRGRDGHISPKGRIYSSDPGPSRRREGMFHSDSGLGSGRRRMRGVDDPEDSMSALRELARAVESERIRIADENSRAVPVVIVGATGPFAPYINGHFDPTREVGTDGRLIYINAGNHNVCLEHVDGYWSVKPMSEKGTPSYYASVQGNCALIECSSRQWMLGDGSEGSIPNPMIRLLSQQEYSLEIEEARRRQHAAEAQRQRDAAAAEAQRQHQVGLAAEAQRREGEAAAAAAALEAQRREGEEAKALEAQRQRDAQAAAPQGRGAAAASPVPSRDEQIKTKFANDLRDSLQNGTPLKREENGNIVMSGVSYSPDSPTIYVSYDGQGQPYTIRAVLGCARTFDLGSMDYLTYAKSNELNDSNWVLLVDRKKLLENLLGSSPSKGNVEQCLKDVTIGPDVQVLGAAAEEPPKQSPRRWNTDPELHPLTLKRRRRRQDALASDMSSTGSFDTVFSSSREDDLDSSSSLSSGLSSIGSQGSMNGDRLNGLADNANDMVNFGSQEREQSSPIGLGSDDAASLAERVGLANPHSLRQVMGRDGNDGLGLGPSSNPASPVANPLSPMSDLVHSLGALNIHSRDNSAKGLKPKSSRHESDDRPSPRHRSRAPGPPLVRPREYSVSIQYTPEHNRKTVIKPASLRVTNAGVNITIDGRQATLDVRVLREVLAFNIARSIDMKETCRWR